MDGIGTFKLPWKETHNKYVFGGRGVSKQRKSYCRGTKQKHGNYQLAQILLLNLQMFTV